MANYDMQIYEKARELAGLLKGSEIYKNYKEREAKAKADENTRTLLDQYHRLQMQAQAALLGGKKDDSSMEQLQKLGELLQFNPAAAEFLMAEYHMGKLLGDVYKILGEAVDVDLRGLEG